MVRRRCSRLLGTGMRLFSNSCSTLARLIQNGLMLPTINTTLGDLGTYDSTNLELFSKKSQSVHSVQHSEPCADLPAKGPLGRRDLHKSGGRKGEIEANSSHARYGRQLNIEVLWSTLTTVFNRRIKIPKLIGYRMLLAMLYVLPRLPWIQGNGQNGLPKGYSLWIMAAACLTFLENQTRIMDRNI